MCGGGRGVYGHGTRYAAGERLLAAGRLRRRLTDAFLAAAVLWNQTFATELAR